MYRKYRFKAIRKLNRKKKMYMTRRFPVPGSITTPQNVCRKSLDIIMCTHTHTQKCHPALFSFLLLLTGRVVSLIKIDAPFLFHINMFHCHLPVWLKYSFYCKVKVHCATVPSPPPGPTVQTPSRTGGRGL